MTCLIVQRFLQDDIHFILIFGRLLIKVRLICYQTIVCLCVCLVALACGQVVGWIKIPLGIDGGLGPGPDHIVADGDIGPPKGAQQLPLMFDPCPLR